jgi:hypothetical protein
LTATQAAVLLPDRNAHDVQGGQLVENFGRKPMLGLDLLCDRFDLLLGHATHLVPNHPVFVGQAEVHARTVGHLRNKNSAN